MALGEFQGDISAAASNHPPPASLDPLSAMEQLSHLTKEVVSMVFQKVG